MTIIYNIETGEIICGSEHPLSEEALDFMLQGGGKAATEGYCQIDDGYVKNGELKLKPPKPDDSHIFDIASEEWVLSSELLEREAMRHRQYLLLKSDWTQLPDVPITTKEVWAVYRQELRDITLQENYPYSITWPVEPE